MNIKRILFASLIIWIVSNAYSWLTCGWLFNWVYDLPPNIWQPDEVIAANIIWIAALMILTSVIFVSLFALLHKSIPGKGIKKGLVYGFLIWLLVVPSGMITLPFYMKIAKGVVIYWAIGYLVLFLLNGAIVGAVYKKERQSLKIM
ncbi:hypothetical protein KY317_01605 [Candidatus Woesearchaeota archaeon]|nr:hypothetical protein [Candidatus Woesearchaeota archaeon]